MKKYRKFQYFINLNERGEFYADVRDEKDKTIFEIASADHLRELVEDGFLRHEDDIFGLFQYLVDMKLLTKNDNLSFGN